VWEEGEGGEGGQGARDGEVRATRSVAFAERVGAASCCGVGMGISFAIYRLQSCKFSGLSRFPLDLVDMDKSC